MTEDPRSDEALVELYHLSDEQAFETLYYRYFKPIGFYIRKHSRYKDENFIEEIRQITFIKISQKIKSGGFVPVGPGTFRAFLYQTAQNICFNQNKNRMRLMKPVSEIFTDEELPGIDGFLWIKDIPLRRDYESINDRIKEITAELTQAELKLMKLVTEKVPYKQIQKESEFQKYSVDYLRRKVHNLRKRMRSKEDKQI